GMVSCGPVTNSPETGAQYEWKKQWDEESQLAFNWCKSLPSLPHFWPPLPSDDYFPISDSHLPEAIRRLENRSFIALSPEDRAALEIEARPQKKNLKAYLVRGVRGASGRKPIRIKLS